MSWLLIVGLKNAVLVVPLAFAAFGLSRWSKRPALAHLIWVLVLVKLLTPPLVDVPVGWQLDVEGWLASAAIETPPASAPTRRASEGVLTCPLPNSVASDNSAPTFPAAISSEPTRSEVAHSHSHPQHASERPAEPRTTASAPAVAILRSPAAWLSLAGLAWLVGSAIVIIVMISRAWRFRRFLRLAGRPDARLTRRVRQLARAAGLSAEPKIAVVESAVSPMLWGLGRRATLIFPAQLAAQLGDDEVDSLLLHELAHFSRGDHWVRLVELAAHMLFWWHPVVWWARREIEAAEEACCDAWVVKHQAGSRRSYAEALLATIEFLSERTPALPPAACGLGDVPLLKLRLTQIVRGETAAAMSRFARVAVLIGGVILSPLEPALWATSSSPRPPQQASRVIPLAAAPAPLPAEPPVDATEAEPSVAAVSAAGMSALPDPAEPPPQADMLIKTPDRLWASAFSPNGQYKLEARTGREIVLSHPGTTWRLDLSSHRIECSSFAPDSESFVTGHADGQLRWWDSETGGLLAKYRLGSSKINSVAFAPDGQRVACGLAEGAAIVWNLSSGQEAASLNGLSSVGSVRWSERGDRLAVATGSWLSGESASLLIWNPSSDQPQQELALARSASALQWLAGDAAVLAGDWNGQTSHWNLQTGDVIPGPAVGKDVANAAGWTPDSPLVSPWQVGDFAPAGELP